MADRRDTETSGGIGFETNKFAFGQRIAVKTDTTSTEVLEEAIDALTRIKGDPLDVLDSLFGSGAHGELAYGYDASQKWLAGADMSFLGLTLRLLFIDSSFYGIGIEFEAPEEDENGDDDNGDDDNGNGNGGERESRGKKKNGDEKKNPFDGLALEVLYRKISEHLGVYSADLTIPKRFRTLEMGAAKVTLPAVGLEVFTNGDFKVSIGWPLGARSLSIQFPPDPIPWAGGGGLYFAKLRSETAPVALGTGFNPILEFGIGLRIGAAIDGNVSILEYAASLYLFGTFEGFLAWEKGSFADGLDYYWFSATVGITGHLEGGVDFKIVKASVSLDLTASVSLALETDHRTQVSATFQVKATAKLKVLFITVHFSFSLTLTERFAFGPAGKPVAQISGPTPSTAGRLAAAMAPTLEPRRTLYSPALEALRRAPVGPAVASATVSTAAFVGATRVAEPTDKPDLTLYFLVQPGVLGSAGAKWQPSAIASLAAPCSAPGTAAGDDAFCQLVQGIARWLYEKLGGGADDFATRLANVSKAIAADRFGLDEVVTCLDDKFTFTIEGTSPDGDKDDVNGALLPLFPGLVLSHDGARAPFPGAPTPTGYAKTLDDYFDQLRVRMRQGGPSPAGATASEGPPPGALVFADFYALLAKQLFHELEGIPGVSDLGAALAKVSYDNLAGMVTRYMVNGMRVPSPTDPDALVGIAALTGQQVALAGGAPPKALGLSLADGAGRPRIAFAGGDDSASAELAAVLTSGPTPGPLWKPAALAPLIESPMRLLLPAGIDWAVGKDARQLLRIPEPVGDIARARGGAALEVAALDGEGRRGEPFAATPALLARFSLARVADPGAPDKHVEDVYQVFGTDEETRERLFAVLADPAALAAVALDLLLPGDAGFITGEDAASAMLVKTNLSTLNQPPLVMARAMRGPGTEPDIGPVHATPKDVEAFLRILWEVSVVHAGGFFLHVTGLDASRFRGSGRVGVALLGRFPSARPTEAPFAVEIDAHHNALVIEAADVPAGARVDAVVLDRTSKTPLPSYRPSYPAGCVGFGATWENPPLDVSEAADDATLANALYHLLQYRIVAGGGYGASNWSLPVGPNSNAEETAWIYRQAFPPYKLLPSGAGGPYATIGKPTTVAFQLLDIYGNAADASVVGDGNLPSLELTPTYNDRLVSPGEWPGVGLGYLLRPGKAAGEVELVLEVAFDSSAIVAAADALRTFRTIHDQLTDPNVEVTLATSLAATPVAMHTRSGSDLAKGLATLVKAICAYLRAVATGGGGPLPVIRPVALVGTIDRSFVASLPDDLFTLDVTLAIRRKVCVGPDGGALPDPQICAIEYAVSAELDLAAAELASGARDDTGKRRTALQGFAQLFEKAYAGFAPGARLKLLEGRQAQTVPGRQRQAGRLWALRWGEGAGVDVVFPNAAGGSGEPVYFASPPLSTKLEEGTFPVRGYGDDGKPGSPKDRSFSRVDLDAWARDFLHAVDALLAPRSSAAIATLDGAAYVALMEAKDAIASAIRGRLTNVLAEQVGDGDARAAEERFEQTLLVRLSNAYSTSAVVQVPVTVAVEGGVGAGARRPAELYGDVAAGEGSGAHQFTISPAALPLAAGNGYLTFLASALHPAAQASLDLELDYDVAFLDHRFETGESEYGYVPSSWLRFALPQGPGGAAPVLEVPMGKVSVPVPLRAFPPTPSLVGQRFEGTHEDAAEIGSALEWTYLLEVGAPAAAQDTLHLEIEFNEPPAADARTMARVAAGETRPPPAHLFEALARFVAEYPEIEPKLELIEKAAFEDGDAGEARQWLADVLELVDGAAKTWAHWSASAGAFASAAAAAGDAAGPPRHAWRYAVRVPDEARPGAVVVTRSADPGTTAPWPSLDGSGPATKSADRATYALERTATDTLELAWAGLDVLARQSAGAAAHVERNADFGGRAATEPFVYVTPTVKFSSALVPLLEIQQPITREPGTSLEDALEQLYADVLARAASGAGNGIFEQNVGYEYALGAGESTLVGHLPVFLTDARLSTARTPPTHFERPDDFAERLAGELAKWHARFRPADDRADVASTLTIFATISDRRLPLARFERIRIPVPAGEPAWWGPAAD